MTVQQPHPGFANVIRRHGRTLKSSELIARDLADYIVDNGLVDGTRLPAEREMAEALGVGRGTLREALRLLEARSVVTIRKGAGGGPTVRRPHPADLAEALTLVLQFQGATLRTVVDAREALETLVVRLATRNIGAREIDELVESASRLRADIDDLDVFYAETRLFHSMINASCGNAVLETFNQTVHAVTHAAVFGVGRSADHRRAVATAHEAILAAVIRRDGDEAAAAMRDHVQESAIFWDVEAGGLENRSVRWSGDHRGR